MITANQIHTAKKAMFTALAVILSAFVFVILVTYSPNDPSWSRISSDMTTVSNMGGSVGAWIADLLYTFFGWSAWWIIAFLAYEALCLWWQRNQAFGLLRIIGYGFLLLASAGLVAIVPQLVGWSDANTARTGGILGTEAARRLSGLVTPYGAGLFLLIFTLITLTFVFDVRWKRVFAEITSLSWLGNGVRQREQAEAAHETHEDVEQDETSTEESEQVSAESPLFRQLKLNLPEEMDEYADYTAEAGNYAETNDAGQDVDSGLNNVLDEFLVNSGLSESILALREQEANSQQQAQQAATKKQEPSFAWNDQQAIDSLLDEDALPVAVADNPQQSTVQSDSLDKNEAQYQDTPESSPKIDEPAAVSPVQEQAALPVEAPKAKELSESAKMPDIEQQILSNELEPTQEASQPVTQHQQPTDQNLTAAQNDVANNDVANSIVNTETATSESVMQSAPVAQSTLNETDSQDITETQDDSLQTSQGYDDSTDQDEAYDVSQGETQPFVDLTPTNTPPSNPKQPPKPVGEEEQTASKPVMPTIRFATPEGESGNHIEDMVPDSDDDYTFEDPEQNVTVPDIHDDSAFASSSRAMQTAKYRESLTPIPELSILDKPDPDRKPSYTQDELDQLSELLEIKLQEFNVKAQVVNAIPGPVVTRFEVDLAAGVKASKVTGISRDLARSLSMASLRVVEVIPGKPYIGIEVPNKKREMVRLIELLETETFKDPKAQISMAMGKDIGGNPIITDLARAPHMLVAGTTGSGKSVLVNSMLLSILLKYKPSELRLILIDPKQLELANYNDIPHLLTPVVTDMNEAASSLAWCVAEMERRYQLMSLLKVRKLSEFNKKVIAAEKAGKPMIDPLWRPNDSVSLDKAPKLKTLPMIVIVADEFADMIMQVGKQAEELITRLAQKSRAAGIHLMLATQRPSVDVITGLIKANIPVRAALRVNSKVDSRTILDAGGAEDMLGNGDMLFLGPGQIEPDRVHGAFVSDEEVNRVCEAWRERGAPDYIDNMAGNFELTSPGSSGAGNTSGEDDALYDEAVAFIMETRKVSASSIQRKFSIGYNRAARIVDSMEEAGLVSAMGKGGKRELLM